MGEPHPGRAAEVERGQVLFGEAGQDGVAEPGASEGARQRGQDHLQRARVGLLGVEPEVARRAGLRHLDEGEGIFGRGCLPRVGQGRRRHFGDTVRADHPGPPGRTDRPAGQRDHADRASALDPVGRGRVQREADIDVAGFLDQHDAAVRPERLRRGHAAPHEFLRRDHGRTTVTGEFG